MQIIKKILKGTVKKKKDKPQNRKNYSHDIQMSMDLN